MSINSIPPELLKAIAKKHKSNHRTNEVHWMDYDRSLALTRIVPMTEDGEERTYTIDVLEVQKWDRDGPSRLRGVYLATPERICEWLGIASLEDLP